MFLVIVISALAVAGFVSTIMALRNDGYRRTPTDPRRLPADAR